MELEPNLLDWNVNELERKPELEDMKRTIVPPFHSSLIPQYCAVNLLCQLQQELFGITRTKRSPLKRLCFENQS